MQNTEVAQRRVLQDDFREQVEMEDRTGEGHLQRWKEINQHTGCGNF
jgi:hypothetical protein